MTLHIALYLFADMEVLDFAGPYEVFTTANRVHRRQQGEHGEHRHVADCFAVHTFARTLAPVRARAGLQVQPDYPLAALPECAVLIVPGGVIDRELEDAELINWLARSHPQRQLTASICTGAFLLAAAGLLDGKRATTHWEDLADLRQRFPQVQAVDGPRWVDEGRVVTSAGIAAGIDMSLYLVERLAGRELAIATARQMDVPWQPSTPAPARPGSAAPSQRTEVKRKAARAGYDEATLKAIIDAAYLCHIGFHDGHSSHCLPMACWRHGDHLYIHGANNSRLMQAVQRGDCAVAISHLDGFVYGRSAMHHSMNYRSAVIYGRFSEVTEAQEKDAAFAHFIEHVSPGRAAQVRPVNPAERSGTRLLRIPLTEAVTKVRSGGPIDDEDDMQWPVWAGVIPLTQNAGTPQAETGSAAYPAPALPSAIAPLPVLPPDLATGTMPPHS